MTHVVSYTSDLITTSISYGKDERSIPTQTRDGNEEPPAPGYA